MFQVPCSILRDPAVIKRKHPGPQGACIPVLLVVLVCAATPSPTASFFFFALCGSLKFSVSLFFSYSKRLVHFKVVRENFFLRLLVPPSLYISNWFDMYKGPLLFSEVANSSIFSSTVYVKSFVSD